jgi:hypothetical protein
VKSKDNTFFAKRVVISSLFTFNSSLCIFAGEHKMLKKLFLSLLIVSVFAIVSYAVKVYPNPWIPADKSNTHNGPIRFVGLPSSGGTIEIFNASGELVRRLSWATGSTAQWDATNELGQNVASGVYIWVLVSGGRENGKIVIVR